MVARAWPSLRDVTSDVIPEKTGQYMSERHTVADSDYEVACLQDRTARRVNHRRECR